MTGFDMVRWLEPWREGWRLIAIGQAPPDANLLRWLPSLARFLGPYAAPTQLLQGAITPSAGYVAGFVDAVSDTWHTAVKDRLLPDNPAALGAWLREPPLPLEPSNEPRFLLTIGDLQTSARKARRIRGWRQAGRIALWALVAVFTLMEIGAIGVTITGGWEKSDPPSNAVFANLCFAVPFLTLATWGYFDLRRHKQRRVDAAVRPDVQSPDQKS
jgi:hypothetical protein